MCGSCQNPIRHSYLTELYLTVTASIERRLRRRNGHNNNSISGGAVGGVYLLSTLDILSYRELSNHHWVFR